MIEQKPVQVGDKTAPASISDIRQRITLAVEATEGTALARLKVWLQMPADTTVGDNDCKVRAEDVGTRLSTDGKKAYLESSLSVALNLKQRWEAIDKKLTAGQAVAINGAANYVGGDKSNFKLGFHVIVFLAVGTDADGGRFYLGFDPDISATEASRAKWKELVPVSTSIAGITDTAKSVQIIKAMILGDSTSGFGPLVRKYYVDTTKAFPKPKYVAD